MNLLMVMDAAHTMAGTTASASATTFLSLFARRAEFRMARGEPSGRSLHREPDEHQTEHDGDGDEIFHRATPMPPKPMNASDNSPASISDSAVPCITPGRLDRFNRSRTPAIRISASEKPTPPPRLKATA